MPFKKSKVYHNKHFPVIKYAKIKFFQLLPTHTHHIYFLKREKKMEVIDERMSTKFSDELRFDLT